jgi:hypothetical protein
MVCFGTARIVSRKVLTQGRDGLSERDIGWQGLDGEFSTGCAAYKKDDVMWNTYNLGLLSIPFFLSLVHRFSLLHCLRVARRARGPPFEAHGILHGTDTMDE